MDRRSILKSSGAALGGALAAGCASVAADGSARSPFKVAAVTLPIAPGNARNMWIIAGSAFLTLILLMIILRMVT